MKKFVLGFAALSLLSPSLAMAGTVSDSLSVRNAAVQPVRAAATKGKTAAVGTPLLLLGLVVVVGGGILLLDDNDDSK